MMEMMNNHSMAYCKKCLMGDMSSSTVHMDIHKSNQVLLTCKKKRLFYCRSGKVERVFFSNTAFRPSLKTKNPGVSPRIALLYSPVGSRSPTPCPLSLLG